MKKSQIAFLIYLGAFALMVLVYSLLTGWRLLYNLIYIYPVQISLIFILLIYSKSISKSIKTFGWITFSIALIYILLFYLLMLSPYFLMFNPNQLVPFFSYLTEGYKQILIYSAIQVMFLIFIVLSVIDIIKHAKKHKIKEN